MILPGGYRLVKMSGVEYRIMASDRSILDSNIESIAVIRDRYVIGECTTKYLDKETDADAKDGWFILDTETHEYLYGMSFDDVNEKLRGLKIVFKNPEKVLR